MIEKINVLVALRENEQGKISNYTRSYLQLLDLDQKRKKRRLEIDQKLVSFSILAHTIDFNIDLYPHL